MTVSNTVPLTSAVGVPTELYVPPPPPVDLSVSAALRYLKLTPGSTVSISDSAANIQKNLATLQSMNARISAVKASSDQNTTLTVTYKEYTADKGILAKWGNNALHQFIFTEVTAQAAGTLWNNDITKSLSIKDTAINIQTNFDSLINIQNQNPQKITSLTQINTSGLINLNTLQYTAGRDSLIFTKLNKGIQNIAITNANVSDVIASDGLRLGLASNVKSISITDSTDNIDLGIDDLQRVGLKIKTISQNDRNIDNILELDALQIRNNASVLGKIITGYQLAAQNTAASQLSSMLANRKVISIDVKDSASNISRNWDRINSISPAINFIEVSQTPSGDPLPSIKLKASQLAKSQELISKFKIPENYLRPVNGINPASPMPTGEFKLEISEATASQVDALQSTNEVVGFDIKDTAENIILYLEDLKKSIDSADGKLQSIKTANTARIEMSFDTYIDPDVSTLLGMINKGLYNIKLTDVTVEDLQTLTTPTLTSNLLFKDKAIESIEIADSVTNVQNSLNLLNATGSRIKSIDLGYSLDDGNPQLSVISALTIDTKDFMNRQKVLEKIIGGYKVDLENATAKQAIGLASNSHVQTIDIDDSANNVSYYWNQLLDINEELDDIKISGAKVSITASQYELGLEADLQNKLTQGSIPFKFGIKDASIDQALSLIVEDQTSNLISSFEIKDTGENITNNLNELNVLLENASLTTSLFQVDPRNELDITYNNFVDYDKVFDAISGESFKLNVSGASIANALNLSAATPTDPGIRALNYRNVSSISISDSSTNLSANFDNLITLGKKLARINLTDTNNNISITYEQYLKGKSVLDRIDDNYSLEIKDAAVYNASSLVNDAHVKALKVYGSASYISKAWDTLAGLGSKLKTILNTTVYNSGNNVSTSIGLSISQWLNSSTLLDKIDSVGSKMFAIYDASIKEAINILDINSGQAALVSDIKIRETSAAIDSSLDAVPGASQEDIDAFSLLSNPKVSQINLVDPKVPMDLTFSQITDNENLDVLEKINNSNFALNVDEASVADAFTLQTQNGATGSHIYSVKVKTISISDSNLHIQTDFDSLKNLTKLDSIGLTGNPTDTDDLERVLTFTATKILEDSSISLFKKITKSPYYLDATNASMSQLTQLYPFDNTVIDPLDPMIDSAVLPNLRNFYLEDSAANVSSSYDQLIALGPKLQGFGLSSGTELNINYAQWQASKGTLLALGSGATSTAPKSDYLFNLSDVSAQDAVGSTSGDLDPAPYNLNTPSIFADTLVKSVVVKDTADEISANWNALQTEFTTTDRPGPTGRPSFTATKLADLVFIDNNPLTLSAAQVVKTHATNNNGIAVYTDLLDIVTPTNGVVIKDTATNLQAYWDDLSELYGNGEGRLGQMISRIELISSDPKIQLTLEQQVDNGDALIQILEGKEYSVETIS